MNKNQKFELAVKNNDFNNTKLLLKEINADFDFENVISIAFKNGYTDIIELFIKDSNWDVSNLNNWAIYSASCSGYFGVVKLLLMDKRVNPADRGNNAVIHAIKEQNWDIVELLLKDKRVNPSDDDCMAVYYASQNRDFDIIKKIIIHPKYNIKTDLGEIISMAHDKGYNEIVDFLWENSNSTKTLREYNPELLDLLTIKYKIDQF